LFEHKEIRSIDQVVSIVKNKEGLDLKIKPKIRKYGFILLIRRNRGKKFQDCINEKDKIKITKSGSNQQPPVEF